MKKLILAITVVVVGTFTAVKANDITFAQGTETKNEIINILNKEDALELLQRYSDGVEYQYQGDENDFEYLMENNLEGYVFLPNIETDLGLFVDKNESKIYYFHPSGYLEVVK